MSVQPIVRGFSFAAVDAGLRGEEGDPDLGLILADRTVTCAGLFAMTDLPGAPVFVSRAKAAGGSARAVLVNSGIANALTGNDGIVAAERMAAALEGPLGIDASEVLVASTGVLGVPLPVEKIEAAAATLADDARPDGVWEFAQAIRTTDTRDKVVARAGKVGGRRVTVVAVAKGSAHCTPNMATLLAFLLTDADIEAEPLEALLRDVAATTFNALATDGEPSPNDTVYALASAHAGNDAIQEAETGDWFDLRDLCRETCEELVRLVAADGPGASRAVEVRVEQAASEEEADLVARRIALSPSLKQAWSRAEPDWARTLAVVAALGHAFDPALFTLSIEGVDLWADGKPTGPDAEAEARELMRADAFTLRLALGRGADARSIHTCDAASPGPARTDDDGPLLAP